MLRWRQGIAEEVGSIPIALGEGTRVDVERDRSILVAESTGNRHYIVARTNQLRRGEVAQSV